MKFSRIIDKTNLKGMRSGAEFKCRCPFHQDTTPSFSINLQSGFYRCWSCGEKGNITSFVKKIFNLEKYHQQVKFINDTLGYEAIEVKKNDMEIEFQIKLPTELESLLEYKDPDYSRLYENVYLLQKLGSNIENHNLKHIFTQNEKIFQLKEDRVIGYINANGDRYNVKILKTDLIFNFGTGLQIIDNLGKKKIYGKMQNSFCEFYIDDKKEVFLCEGLATALSYIVLGYNAIVGLSFDNMIKVVANLTDSYHKLWVSWDNVNKTNLSTQALGLKWQYEAEDKYNFQSINFEKVDGNISGFDFNDMLVSRGIIEAKKKIDEALSNFDIKKYLISQKLRIYSNKTGKYTLIYKDNIYKIERRDILINTLMEKLKWFGNYEVKEIRKKLDEYIFKNTKDFDSFGYSPSLPYTAEYTKFEKVFINEYKESGIQLKPIELLSNKGFNRVKNLIMHLCEEKEEYYNWFINFLANKIQHPENKPHLGIIFYSNGITGTGKSTLGKILKAIFGENINVEIKQKSILSGRNSFFFNNILWIAEEVDLADGNIMQIIKTALTSSILTKIDKYITDVEMENFSNGIFFSDKMIPIKLDKDDRRFVIFKCEKKLPQNECLLNEINDREVIEEIESFYSYLLNYECFPVKTIFTESRETLMLNSISLEDEFLDTLLMDIAISYYHKRHYEGLEICEGAEPNSILIPSKNIANKLKQFAFDNRETPMTLKSFEHKISRHKTEGIQVLDYVLKGNHYFKKNGTTYNCFKLFFNSNYVKNLLIFTNTTYGAKSNIELKEDYNEEHN